MPRTLRRQDDPRPGSGFKLILNGTTYYLSRGESRAAAQIAQLQQALGAAPEEIATAVEEWLKERKKAKKWFFGWDGEK